tara:strand:+ start:719 stop:1333 length:615 start_codon:yes stop_codon:yes gene_type:complete
VLTNWLEQFDSNLLNQLINATGETHIEDIASENSRYIKNYCIIFLDLSGFGKLTESSRDFEALRLILITETIISKLAVDHNGTLLKSIGDSWLLKFSETTKGVHFLKALYKKLNETNTGNPQQLAAIPCGGIAYGALLEFGDYDIIGRTVNVAARAGEDVAGPWEVLIAESALEQAAIDSEIKITDHIMSGEKVYSWLPLGPMS